MKCYYLGFYKKFLFEQHRLNFLPLPHGHNSSLSIDLLVFIACLTSLFALDNPIVFKFGNSFSEISAILNFTNSFF